MNFVLLTVSPFVTTAQLELWAPAFEASGAAVAAAWSSYDRSIVPPTVRVADAVSKLRDGDTPIVVAPSLPLEDAGDAAFHWVRNRIAFGLVLADGTQTVDDLTLATDHELAETIVDPTCDRYLNGDAAEVADPVQEHTVSRPGADGTLVACAAFVTPAWFGIGGGPTVVSDTGLVLAPGEVAPGGYKMRKDGSRVPPGYRAAPHKDHRLSRAARRRRAGR